MTYTLYCILLSGSILYSKDGHKVQLTNLRHCSVCGKTCTSKSKLAQHMRVHTGERPYQCNECGRKFRQKPHLNTHMGTHWKANK